MEIQALNYSLLNENELFVNAAANQNADNDSQETTNKEAINNAFSWLNDYARLITGGKDTSSSLSSSAGGLNFTRSIGGWRSGAFSFLSGSTLTQSTSTTNSSRFANLRSFNMNTQNEYSSAASELYSTLQGQLKEAKSKLSQLESEKEAKEKELESGYNYSTGKKLSKKGKEEMQELINSYSSQIIMQKSTVSNLESKISSLS